MYTDISLSLAWTIKCLRNGRTERFNMVSKLAGLIQFGLIPCRPRKLFGKFVWGKHHEHHEQLEELRDRLDRIVQVVQVKAPDLPQKYQAFRNEDHKSDAFREVLAVVSDLENELRKIVGSDPETDTSSFSHESSTLVIDKRNQESYYDAEIARLKAESSQMRQDFESEKDEKEQMRNTHEHTINYHKAELLRINDDFQFEKDRMIDKFESEKAELKVLLVEREAALDNEKKTHAAQRWRIEQGFNAEKLRIQSHCNENLAKMESECKASILRMKKEFAAQDARLRGDIESLNGALLARDRFTPITDHELESRFSDLVEDIDQLARPEWDFNQAEWTDNLLNRLSKNPKRLKKELLQDSLWMILYENIFCSPFRVFGEEGRKLEAQWNDAFGKGLLPFFCLGLFFSDIETGSQSVGRFYNWPTPGLEAERWRYETIKQCQEALAQSASDLDPRAKLKKNFKISLDNTRKKLSDAVAKVSGLDKGLLQSLDDIPKKAAKMWIEMGTQRCRIFVFMQGSNLTSQSDRVKKACEDVLELVIIPQLWRFGNSKGQDLYKKELIKGCDGSISSVRMP